MNTIAQDSNSRLQKKANIDNLMKTEMDASRFELTQFDDSQYGIKRIDDERTMNLSESMFGCKYFVFLSLSRRPRDYLRPFFNSVSI